MKTTSVKRDIWVRGSLDRVWEALTDANQRKHWDAWEATIDFRVGGKVLIQHGWGAVTSNTISEIKDKEKFVLTSDDGGFQNITTLTPEGEGVRVTIEYRMAWVEDASMKENMAFGTYWFLQNLKSVLEDDIDLRPAFWPTWLGIQHTSILTDDDSLGQGTRILQVKKDSPAETGDLMKDDIIIKVNQTSIRNYDDLEMVLQNSEAGEIIQINVIRNGDPMQLTSTLAPYPRAYRE